MKRELTELNNFEHLSENIDAKKVANYGYDPETGEWRRFALNQSGQIITSEELPQTSYTWSDGVPTQKVEEYTDRTVTTDYTWTNGELTNKEVTIT